MPKFIRYNPTTDSSTNTWKRQLQAAAGTRKTEIYTEVCDAFKPEPISNHFTATTVGANKELEQTILYRAGKETCGCAGQTKPPPLQYISSPTLAIPENPIKGVNAAGCCDTFVQRYPVRNNILLNNCDSDGPCPGKGMTYPSG